MEISDLESLYRHLEKKALDYKRLHEIANLFQKIRDEMRKKQKTEEKTKAQWEMDTFNFSIKNNTITPLWRQVNGDGKEIRYPSFDEFTDDAYDYIIERLDSTSNSLLKARYAHVLWFSPRKHGKYAQMAIDAYLVLTRLYEQKDRERPKEHYGLDVLDTVKNGFFLSRNIRDKERLDAVKSEVKRLVFSFNPESSSLFRLRTDLVSLMLKEKTTFLRDDFAEMNEMCFQFAKELKNSHKAITMCELGKEVDNRLGTTTHNWTELIAKSYENMMKSNLDKNKSVAIKFCQDALKYYERLKDSEKIDELKKIYNDLKDKVEFKEFKMELNLKKYIENCERKARKIAQHSSEEIFSLLTWDKNLLPKYGKMKILAEETLKEHPLQGLFPIEIVDERGHNVEYFSSEDEILYYRTLWQYQLYLENQFLPLINAIIFEALKEQKMTFGSLMDYFQKHSWFGKTLKKQIQNREIQYSWMNLLAPSLLEYFSQMEYSFASQKYPNLILCIDSLAVKIEGLLRDLCNYSGITTFFQKTDKQGRTVYQEKDLNALLHEEKIKELFDEDELLFFRFVLVEKAGYNLRQSCTFADFPWGI